MTQTFFNIPGSGPVTIYATSADFPITADPGTIAIAADTGDIYEFYNNTWNLVLTPTGVPTPEGPNGSIQYNNAGAFAGFGSWDGTQFNISQIGTTSGDLTLTSSSGNLNGSGLNAYNFSEIQVTSFILTPEISTGSGDLTIQSDSGNLILDGNAIISGTTSFDSSQAYTDGLGNFFGQSFSFANDPGTGIASGGAGILNINASSVNMPAFTLNVGAGISSSSYYSFATGFDMIDDGNGGVEFATGYPFTFWHAYGLSQAWFGATPVQQQTGDIGTALVNYGLITSPTIDASEFTGTVIVGNGGTGINSGTSGGIPYFSSTSAMASSSLLTNHAIVLGGGSGAAPTVVSGLGTSSQVLIGNASGAPSFGAITVAMLPTVVMTSNTTATATFNTATNDETIYDTSTTLISALTIALPSTTRVGQILRYVSNRTVTTTTVTGTVLVGATPVLAANSSIAYQAVNTSGSFIRIQ